MICGKLSSLKGIKIFPVCECFLKDKTANVVTTYHSNRIYFGAKKLNEQDYWHTSEEIKFFPKQTNLKKCRSEPVKCPQNIWVKSVSPESLWHNLLNGDATERKRVLNVTMIRENLTKLICEEYSKMFALFRMIC